MIILTGILLLLAVIAFVTVDFRKGVFRGFVIIYGLILAAALALSTWWP